MSHRSTPIDGFRLAYDLDGDGPPVVLLHGWPGDRTDYRLLRSRLAGHAKVVVPDLRGFGESDKHDADPSDQYSAQAQVRSVAGLIDELGLGPVVVGGYDVGSRVAQTLARARPDLVRAMVLAPPMPGVGARVLDAAMVPEFWYQSFHQLELALELVDGRPDAVRAYLRHFWTHWSGPAYEIDDAAFDALAERYSAPGAFWASINWYRAGSGTLARAATQTAPAPDDRDATPLTVLWPEHDPLFPREWADGVAQFFSRATVREVDGVGHFAPLEYPDVMAEALLAAVTD